LAIAETAEQPPHPGAISSVQLIIFDPGLQMPILDDVDITELSHVDRLCQI
jgi:hypothetical protein